MDTYDTTWAAISQWTGGLDERGLAAYRELAMARAPLRRLGGAPLPVEAALPGTGNELLGSAGPRKGGRPGRRW
jgi:hypothetical protein